MKKSNPCRVIAFANRKGGTAKTGSTVSLATLLAILGHKVLVVDSDPQGNSTEILDCFPEDQDSRDSLKDYSDVLLGRCSDVHDAIQHSRFGMDVLVNEKKVDQLSDEFVEYAGRGNRLVLNKILEPLKDEYEFIFIDTNPADNCAADNALVAADGILVPIQEDGQSSDGATDNLKKAQFIRDNYKEDYRVHGLFLCNVDPRTNLTKYRKKLNAEAFGDIFLTTHIRRDNLYKNSASFYEPIYFLQKKSNVGTDYINLALELGLITKSEYKKLDGLGYIVHTDGGKK